MLNEIDVVVLTDDVTTNMMEGTLKSGDVGTIVHVYGQGEAYEVEFLAPDGNTVGLAYVLPSQVRPVIRYEFDHARGRAKVVWRDPTFVEPTRSGVNTSGENPLYENVRHVGSPVSNNFTTASE